MNKLYFLLIIVLWGVFSCSVVPPKVSVIGDSYSTFQGSVIPDTNLCYYGVPDNGVITDVQKVADMWWHRFINEHGCKLEYNNSYSGSTICNTGYEKADFTDRSFISRMANLGNPDIILIFGGTNDCWVNSPIGNYQYSNWKKENLYYFRPAFSYLLDYLSKHYPKSLIYNTINTDLSHEITDSMNEICRHYEISSIYLHDIEKQGGHPTLKGMKSISDQVWKTVSQDLQ